MHGADSTKANLVLDDPCGEKSSNPSLCNSAKSGLWLALNAE